MRWSVDAARPGDEFELARIANAVAFHNQPRENAGRTGFLVFGQSAESYRDRIRTADFFFVARDGETLAGFINGFSARALTNGALPHEPETVAAVLKHAPDGVYLDQIAVDPPRHGSGVAAALYEAFSSACAGRAMLAAIAHAPVRNQRSLGFFKGKMGWRLLEEFRQEEWIWGLYTQEGGEALKDRTESSLG